MTTLALCIGSFVLGVIVGLCFRPWRSLLTENPAVSTYRKVAREIEKEEKL